jgi:purine-nucleoside phosphorylase
MLGTRFPDMTYVYDPHLTDIMRRCAKELNIDLKEGVYLQTTGPNYETPAEINMYRTLGADAVGMSTACEALAAIHCGFQVCGISCITNMAAGITKKPLSDEEIGIIAGKASNNFCNLVKNIILSL